MTTKTRIFLVMVMGGLLPAMQVAQADSGMKKRWPVMYTDLETMGQEVALQQAGQAVRFKVREVTNPASYPNVILDVFSYPDNQLLGEGRWTSTGGNAEVSLLAQASDRKLTLIVRSTYNVASPPAPQTGVPLAASNNNGSSWTLVGQYDIAPQARIMPAGGLTYATVVTTVEEPKGKGGASDTILMVLEDDKPIAFDDDMGIERMSRLSIGQICGAGGHTCSILPARRSNHLADRSVGAGCGSFAARAGTTTVVWDEDIANGFDADGDGLGDALETALGTSSDPNDRDPNNPDDNLAIGRDTDKDGIWDGWEVLGIPNFDASTPKDFCKRNVLKFPYYGADPMLQDLFAEVDWMPACTDPDIRKCAPGHPTSPPGVQDKDAWQWSRIEADDFVNRFAPDFRAHVDIGPWPGVDDTYDYGNWGGANLLPDTVDVSKNQSFDRCGFSNDEANQKKIPDFFACEGFGIPTIATYPDRTECWLQGERYYNRVGLFAHMAVKVGEGGVNHGLCSRIGKQGGNGAHETGHFLGLGHGGKDSAGASHCKANYFSMLSYCGDWDQLGNSKPFPGFSHGNFTAGGKYGEVVLNPMKMEERKGLGTKIPDVMNYITKAMGRIVGSDPNKPSYGGVDWDDDGEIEPGTENQVYLNHGSNQNNQGMLDGPWGGDPSPSAGDGQSFPRYDAISIFSTGWNQFYYGIRYAYWSDVLQKTHLGYLLPTPSTDPKCSGPSGPAGNSNNCQTLTSWWGIDIENRVDRMFAVRDDDGRDLVVFRDADNQELYYVGTPNYPAGVHSLSRRRIVGPPTVVGTPFSFPHSNYLVRVFASVAAGTVGGGPDGGVTGSKVALYSWSIDRITGKVANSGAGIQQYWEDGSEIYLEPGAAIGATMGKIRDATGTVTEALVAAIPSLDPTTGQTRLELAILNETVTASGVLVDKWERQWKHSPADPDPLTQISSSARKTGPGRVGLTYAWGANAHSYETSLGRYYLTWQNLNGDGKAVVLLSMSRGIELPADSTCMNARSLCFPSYGRFNDGDTDWPAGLQLVTTGTRVRAVLSDNRLDPKVNILFPHADGVVDMDQKDFKDYQFIQEHLPCALQHCPNL